VEQIIVQLRDKEKAQVLFELLSALDFVDSVKTSEAKDISDDIATSEESLDFFSFAGLWQDRKVTIESIRQKAWPRQHS
jgi:hypothetical protein